MQAFGAWAVRPAFRRSVAPAAECEGRGHVWVRPPRFLAKADMGLALYTARPYARNIVALKFSCPPPQLLHLIHYHPRALFSK